MTRAALRRLAPLALAAAAWGCAAVPPATDGRLPLATLAERHAPLATTHGWTVETLYAYPGEPDLAIRGWRTLRTGPALWVIAGIHGEEPAGPNAIAERVPLLAELAARGVPVVLLPLCNPRAYRNNWRYPNTPERDWRAGGYSVGDAEWLLPAADAPERPRAAAPPGPETAALTRWALDTAARYPPLLVLDLHEDELSTAGGYLYSQGEGRASADVAAAVVRALQGADMPLRLEGRTRFGEPITGGVISRDDAGEPIRDGSIDELLAAGTVVVGGARVPGPGAPVVIVVETPAFAGSRLAARVAAQAAVLDALPALWGLAGGALQ